MENIMNEKRLIINADDFAYTPGVTYGIIEAYQNGIVSSTTALTVSDYFLSAMEIAQKLCPQLPIGLHLTLTLNKAKPILSKKEVPSLTNEEGFFWNQSIFKEKNSYDEVYLEWEAQYLKFLESGRKPTHLDSHHHVHGQNEELLKVALKLAKKYDLPLRNAVREESKHLIADLKTTDELLYQFYGEGVTFENLKEIVDYIHKSQYMFFELSVHPAFLDYQIPEVSNYSHQRIKELEILTSLKAKNLIQEAKIILTDFSVF